MTERRIGYRINPTDIPPETRAALTARARSQTVEKFGLTTIAFDQAEAIVEAGHVVLQGRNYGLVYDDSYPDAWRHGWLSVSLRYCAHCGDAPATAPCIHQLAVAFQDLLARHIPARTGTPSTSSTGSPFTPVGPRGLGHGRYTSTPRWRRRARRNGSGKRDHCPHCGAFLTAEGGCNNQLCGRRR